MAAWCDKRDLLLALAAAGYAADALAVRGGLFHDLVTWAAWWTVAGLVLRAAVAAFHHN